MDIVLDGPMHEEPINCILIYSVQLEDTALASHGFTIAENVHFAWNLEIPAFMWEKKLLSQEEGKLEGSNS